MGDHQNGASSFKVTPDIQHLFDDADFFKRHNGSFCSLDQLFELDPAKYFGQAYVDRFGKSKDAALNMVFLFKVLSVGRALSI